MSSPPPPPPPPLPPSSSPDYYYYMVVTIAAIIVMLVASNVATFACQRRRPMVNPRIVDPRGRIGDRIPVTKYVARDADERCSVCLTGFAEGEELRQLPGCTHAFHAPCIDMWLYSHSTCPLCRRAVMALPPPPQQRCPEAGVAGVQAEAQGAPVFAEASNMGQLVVAIV